MSETAAEILKRMRAERAAPAAVKKGPEDPYVRLLIAPSRRRQLTLCVAVAMVVFTVLVFRDLNIDKPWWVTGLPIMGIGLMIAFVPRTEEWEYKPWQTSARQYERHQVER